MPANLRDLHLETKVWCRFRGIGREFLTLLRTGGASWVKFTRSFLVPFSVSACII